MTSGKKQEIKLKQTLSQDKFAITCELTPPRGIDIDGLSTIIEKLKDKIDAVNVNDNPNSNVRMSSLIFSKFLLDSISFCFKQRGLIFLPG